nr:MAG TPA: hypothetical protein [Caudoviricetes sp.]
MDFCPFSLGCFTIYRNNRFSHTEGCAKCGVKQNDKQKTLRSLMNMHLLKTVFAYTHNEK